MGASGPQLENARRSERAGRAESGHCGAACRQLDAAAGRIAYDCCRAAVRPRRSAIVRRRAAAATAEEGTATPTVVLVAKRSVAAAAAAAARTRRARLLLPTPATRAFGRQRPNASLAAKGGRDGRSAPPTTTATPQRRVRRVHAATRRRVVDRRSMLGAALRSPFAGRRDGSPRRRRRCGAILFLREAGGAAQSS